MKARLMAGVLAVVLAASFAYAQDFTTSVAQGSKSMLFSFQGLSDLGAGDYNGGIGGKYFLSNNIGIRVGLVFGNYSQVVVANPGAGMTGTDGSRSGTEFGINAAVEYHLLPTRVSPYVGAGVSFTSASTEVKSMEVGNPPPAQDVTKNSAAGVNGYYGGTELAVGGLVGVEFFLTKEVSLGAEYWVGYSSFSPADQEFTTGSITTTTKQNSSSYIELTSSGYLTLSIYF